MAGSSNSASGSSRREATSQPQLGNPGLPSTSGPLTVGHDELNILAGVKHGLRFLFSDYIMVLSPFTILGIMAHFLNWPNSYIFVCNFIAIIPLAKLLSDVTEDLSLRLGEAVGGLLNATFGNAIELIVVYFALSKNMTDIVKASLLGSILSNVLLVLGGAFLVSGYYYEESKFNVLAAQTSASLLFMAVIAFVLPAAYVFDNDGGNSEKVLAFCRSTSVIVLTIYVLFLFFQLKTHKKHLTSETTTVEGDSSLPLLDTPLINRRLSNASLPLPLTEHEIETPQLPMWFAVSMLIIVTLVVSFCSEYLVGTLEQVAEDWNISKGFIGIILLPIVGNAAEHVTAITVAAKDKMDLSLGVAVGSSMQIALFVTPLSVLMGWAINVDMDLKFTTFETSVVFVSIMMVNYIIGDGRSNWLEGCMLLATYTIVALAYWIN